eukprot:ANDGO_08114.mRNA.1 hypothetical protein
MSDVLSAALLRLGPPKRTISAVALSAVFAVLNWVSAGINYQTSRQFYEYVSKWKSRRFAEPPGDRALVWIPWKFKVVYSSTGERQFTPSRAVFVQHPNFEPSQSTVDGDSNTLPLPSPEKIAELESSDLSSVPNEVDPTFEDEFADLEFDPLLDAAMPWTIAPLSESEILHVVDQDRTRILDSLIRLLPPLSDAGK